MLQRMLALFILALVVAACNGPATSSLTVTNLVPEDGATGVAVDTAVSATFNLGINEDTLDGAFTLTGGGETVEGDLAYNAGNRTATFRPDGNLAFGTEYTAILDGTVATDDGVALGGAASWSFTTVGVPGTELVFATAADEYPLYGGVSSIGADGEFAIEFPAFVNAVGTTTFELIQAEASPDLLRSIDTYAFVPPWNEEITIESEQHGLTFDTGTGTISGRTPFPGTYTGTVRLTDSDGQTLEADYEIVLTYTAAYLVDDTDVVVPPGAEDAGEARFTLVAGDTVTIAGANPLAFGARPETDGPTLIAGTEREFALVRVDDPNEAGAGADGLIEINAFDGVISVLSVNVQPATTAQTWIYEVVVTHTETNQTVTAETFTFTLAAAAN